MRRSEAARYARWSASVAVLLALLTTGVYLDRRWTAHVDRRNAPPPAPGGVKERLSHGVTFSKEEGNRRIFTVEASNSTEFRDRDSTLLESVKITIFGNHGERHDVIRTESCQYAKGSGSIECSGEVQMDLQSAADAARVASDPGSGAAQVVHVATRAVTFDRAKGAASSDQPVTFRFPEGQGRAVGLQYNSDQGTMRLLRNVQFTLDPEAAASKPSPQIGPRSPVEVTGSSMDFDRDSRRMVLHGPAEARTQNAHLTAPEMTLDLNTEFHAQTFRAEKTRNERPRLQLSAANGSSEVTADALVARLAGEGWLEKVDASGEVRGWREAEGRRDDFESATASLELWPRVTQPREVNLNGAVTVKSRERGAEESRTLQTESLRLEFSAGTQKALGRMQLAQTLAPGSLEWTDKAEAGSLTRLKADRLRLEFGGAGKPSQWVANGNVQTERTIPDRAAQTATAESATAQLEASGGWTQMDLQGDVRLQEGERNARAEHAVLRRAEQTAMLAGNPVVRDANTQTSAARITFRQATGDIQAQGGVRTSDLSSAAKGTQTAGAPLNISAETMQANSKSGQALYSKHARLWQGDSVMEADSIQIERATRVLTATDHVRAAFVQAPAKTTVSQASAQEHAATTATPEPESKSPNLWHVAAGKLTYYDAENRAHLERNVMAQSAQEKIRAPIMDLYFARAGAGFEAKPAAQPVPGGLAPGSQQISRAVGIGGVTVEEGARKATAERGEYTAADGKFVMSGGNPTIYDGSAGTTTGRKLTFFLADDTIIVDSQDGSRTLTKHRVE